MLSWAIRTDLADGGFGDAQKILGLPARLIPGTGCHDAPLVLHSYTS
jgi:hypothetical protein